MTLETLSRAKYLQKHINELVDFKDGLSIVKPIRVGDVSIDVTEADIEALEKALEERIAKLEAEFEAL